MDMQKLQGKKKEVSQENTRYNAISGCRERRKRSAMRIRGTWKWNDCRGRRRSAYKEYHVHGHGEVAEEKEEDS
jgi:hypothetical protein